MDLSTIIENLTNGQGIKNALIELKNKLKNNELSEEDKMLLLVDQDMLFMFLPVLVKTVKNLRCLNLEAWLRMLKR